jgi:hypothetical protein
LFEAFSYQPSAVSYQMANMRLCSADDGRLNADSSLTTDSFYRLFTPAGAGRNMIAA